MDKDAMIRAWERGELGSDYRRMTDRFIEQERANADALRKREKEQAVDEQAEQADGE